MMDRESGAKDLKKTADGMEPPIPPGKKTLIDPENDTKKRFQSRCYHRVRARLMRDGMPKDEAKFMAGVAHEYAGRLWDEGAREGDPRQPC